MAMKKKISEKRLTNERMMHILMDEMVDMRNELREDIQNLDKRLSVRIDGLDSKVMQLSVDLKSLRLEVHQNQTTFMKNHNDLEKRVTVLEAKFA